MTQLRALALVGIVIAVLTPGYSWAGGRGSTGGGGRSHGGGFKGGHAFAKPVHHGLHHRGGHHHGFHHHARSVFPHPVDPWKFWGAKTGHHHSFVKHHHPFASGFVGTSGVVFTGTTVVYAPPVVIAPPAPIVYVAPPPPPTPTVIEYPTGRYELRGDGVTSAYQWIWIPKTPPPPPPPPEAPPEPQSRPPAREDRTIGKVYRWTDEDGVITLTDRLENVPERYRPR